MGRRRATHTDKGTCHPFRVALQEGQVLYYKSTLTRNLDGCSVDAFLASEYTNLAETHLCYFIAYRLLARGACH